MASARHAAVTRTLSTLVRDFAVAVLSAYAATITGAVDVNPLPGGSVACVLGPSARGAGGPLLSNVAGGWLHSGRTGAAVVSSQRHTPFWTGLRSYDAPGRCSVFTVQSATLHLSFVCGSTLPVFVRWPRFLCTWLVADSHCVVESLNDLFVTC